jgi:hypothetical protein
MIVTDNVEVDEEEVKPAPHTDISDSEMKHHFDSLQVGIH